MLTDENLRHIRDEGHTRIPIYDTTPAKVVGILLAKQLLGRDVEECTVESVMRQNVVRVNEDQRLDSIFEDFLQSRQHLFIVENDEGNCIGIVSLEDVIEEIIREEIEDESDV